MPEAKEKSSQRRNKNGVLVKVGIGVAVPVLVGVVWFSVGWVNSRASAEDLEQVKTTCDVRETASAEALKQLAEEAKKDAEFRARMDEAMKYLVPGYKGQN